VQGDFLKALYFFTENGGSACINVSIKGLSTGKVHPKTSYEGPDGNNEQKSTLSLTSIVDVYG
jgi:hypothetical protein